MTLHFGSPYWPHTYADPPHYPALRGKQQTNAVIIGGGMSGVTCGYILAGSGIDAILIEQGDIAAGSTLSNTGLLQFTNDKMLSAYAAEIGEEEAVRFYRACRHAAEHLNTVAERLPRSAGFRRRTSLYYASAPDDLTALRQEYEMLDKYGFGVEWWGEAQIAAHFPFRKAGAIATRGDAEVNPFRLVHAMAEEAQQNGLAIYEKTSMLSVEPSAGGYRVVTDQGEIQAAHVIYAVGYIPEVAGGRWIRAKLNRTYAIVTEPVASLADWHERMLLWETARPYLYFRTTEDGRIIAGGLDEPVRMPVLSEQELSAHGLRLSAELRALFPELSPEIRYQWCATFGESADGLPWLGEDPDRPGQFYCLGYGGNGTIYSMLGAEIIRDRLLGIDNPIAPIVRPDRKNARPAKS